MLLLIVFYLYFRQVIDLFSRMFFLASVAVHDGYTVATVYIG